MDIATWLNITNSSKLESQILAPLIEAAHDEELISVVFEYTFLMLLSAYHNFNFILQAF